MAFVSSSAAAIANVDSAPADHRASGAQSLLSAKPPQRHYSAQGIALALYALLIGAALTTAFKPAQVVTEEEQTVELAPMPVAEEPPPPPDQAPIEQPEVDDTPPPPMALDPIAPIEEVKPAPKPVEKVEKKVDKPVERKQAAAPRAAVPAARAPARAARRAGFGDRQPFPRLHAARGRQRLSGIASAAHRAYFLSRDIRAFRLADLLFDFGLGQRRLRRGGAAARRPLRFGSGARKAGVAVRFADLQPLIALALISRHERPEE